MISIFQDGGRRHLGFVKFQTFNGRTAEEGRTASPCQIWSKSAKMQPRGGDFSIFQDGGRRHLECFKFQTFNGRTAQEGRTIGTFPWPKRACLAGALVFTESYRNLTPVDFGRCLVYQIT